MKFLRNELFLKILFLVIIIAAAIGAFQWAQRFPQAREFIRLTTTRNPETFTELYFEDHTTLPTYVELDRAYPYRFTIHNLEGRDMRYTYDIYIDYQGKKLPLTRESVFIQDGQAKTISQTLLQHKPKGRVKVVVSLVGLNQYIDFWIQNK